MTTSLDLDAIERASSPDGARRDQRGRYLIVDPTGKLAGYRRATTVAKILETDFALTPWSQSRAVLGLLREPKLMRRARKLLADFGDDPWYSGGKGPTKALLADAERAGGRWERADRGTYLHAVLAAVLTSGEEGVELELDEAASRWLEGVLAAIGLYRVTINPDGVERLVVNDTLRIAGTADYLEVTVPGYPRPMIGDLKTGSTIDYGVNSWAIQTAIYATAEAVYEQGADPNGSADVRGAMPDLDLDHALVIHAPADGGDVELLVVDIAAGRVALELALEVEAWRKADVVTPLCADLTPVLEASLAAVAADDDRPSGGDVAGVADDLGVLISYRAWIQERIDIVGRHDIARADLVRRWPADLPTLRRSDAHTIDELAGLEAILDAVEASHSIPFGPQRPGGDELRVLRLVRDTFGAT